MQAYLNPLIERRNHQRASVPKMLSIYLPFDLIRNQHSSSFVQTLQGLKLLEALLYGISHKRHVLVGDAQRRCHDQHVINPGCGVAIVAKDQSLFVTSRDEFIHRLRTYRLLALLILYDLYAEQEPLAADVPHLGMRFKLGKLLAQALAQHRRATGEVFILHYLQIFYRHSASGWIAAKRVYLAQASVLLRTPKPLEHLPPNGRRRQGQVPASHRFAYRDDVGLDIVVVVAEFLASSAEAAAHLVHDQ